MRDHHTLWPSPQAHMARTAPDTPTLYFAPAQLRRTAALFTEHFPGLVTYAVKANDAAMVLDNLVAAGLDCFDVASPAEMAMVRAACPGAVLHYNNPVRSAAEIAAAKDFGIASWSIDCRGELDKLGDLPAGTEISVRLRLPVKGAAYDFGAKFGADPEEAATLLAEVARRGLVPAICFHPGTQCADPEAWAAYIAASAEVARRAGVTLARLNVGGGFAAHRGAGPAPCLHSIFARIASATEAAFGAQAPKLLCEPGRAMVAEAFALGLRVKALRPDGSIFLNDGIYGALAEARDMGTPERLRVLSPEGQARTGTPQPRAAFGPTCDSLDRLPAPLALPADMAEGDHLLIYGMGAYSSALATRFNGFGPGETITVESLGA